MIVLLEGPVVLVQPELLFSGSALREASSELSHHEETRHGRSDRLLDYLNCGNVLCDGLIAPHQPVTLLSRSE